MSCQEHHEPQSQDACFIRGVMQSFINTIDENLKLKKDLERSYEVRSELATRGVSLGEENAQLKAQNAELLHERELFLEATKENSKLRVELEDCRTKVVKLTQMNAYWESELAAMNKRFDELAKPMQEMTDAKLKYLSDELQLVREAHRESRASLEEIQQKRLSLFQSNELLAKENADLKAVTADLKAIKYDLEKEANFFQTVIAARNQTIKECEDGYAKLSKQNEGLVEQIRAINQAFAELERTTVHMNIAKADADRKLADSDAEINRLKGSVAMWKSQAEQLGDEFMHAKAALVAISKDTKAGTVTINC